MHWLWILFRSYGFRVHTCVVYNIGWIPGFPFRDRGCFFHQRSQGLLYHNTYTPYTISPSTQEVLVTASSNARMRSGTALLQNVL